VRSPFCILEVGVVEGGEGGAMGWRGMTRRVSLFYFLVRDRGRGGQGRGGATKRGGAARERRIRVSLGCFGLA